MAPIYNFQCSEETCKHEFEELFTSWNDDTSAVKCPKCGKSSKKIPSVNASRKENWSNWNR